MSKKKLKKLKEKLRRAKSRHQVARGWVKSYRDLALALSKAASLEEPRSGSSEWRPMSERPVEKTRAVLWDSMEGESFLGFVSSINTPHPDYTHWLLVPPGPVLCAGSASPEGSRKWGGVTDV